jgi:hypothetical protein
VNPHDGFQERLAAAIALPDSAYRFLYLYWLLATERLKRLAAESSDPLPPPHNGEGLQAWRRKAQEHVDKEENLTLQLRRVERYLGHKPMKIDMRKLQDAKCLTAAKWNRAAIQDDYSDEEIAAWFKSFLASNATGRRGRPSGTVDCDGHALLALVLFDSDPKLWGYPKLADALLGCDKHIPHTADSECVDKLGKSVERLRKFLREIGYTQSGN